MIPKIIHFCWLSGDEYPELIQQCMATWKVKLPDYEFMLWDAKRFDLESTLWTKQAFESKKYAFASDYIRLYAIHKYGGIYLDTDVEVIKNFDDLLNRHYFIGLEQNDIIEAAVFGAEKGTDWLVDCMQYYDNRSFIKEDGSPDLLILPKIMESQIEQKRKLIPLENDELKKVEEFIQDKTKLIIYPFEFFSAKNHETQEITKTKNTYTIHHFNNAWIPKRMKIRMNLKRKLLKAFGVDFTDSLIGYSGFRMFKKIIKGTK